MPSDKREHVINKSAGSAPSVQDLAQTCTVLKTFQMITHFLKDGNSYFFDATLSFT
jgi:hypothetical protein